MPGLVKDTRVLDDLLPNVIDSKAKTRPSDVWAEFPVSDTGYQDGFRSVTNAEFANAVNGAARWLLDTLGAPKQKHEVIAYAGPNDVRAPAMVLGAAKVGYVVFLTSPRNSLAAHTSLFDRVGCTTVLSGSPHQPTLTTLADQGRLRIIELPEKSSILDKQHEHVALDQRLSDVLNDPFIIIHTSGSTGIPKPLFVTNAILSSYTRIMNLPPTPGHDSTCARLLHGRSLILSPPFHAIYICMMFCACMRLDLIFVAPAPKAIPSAVGVAEALEQRPSYTAVIPPSIIQDMSHVPSLLERTAKNLEYLYYGGGDLPQSVGDFVNQKIKLVDVYGSTEMGVPPLLSAHDRHASDWKYLHFRANSGYEMRAYDGNVYELVVNRKDQDEEWQVPFKFYPSLDEYHTNDLWSRHPEHPDLYRWEARADDIIVFLNGEKTNPVSMEMHIVGANQEVSAALVVGARRFQAALLVEMADAEQELSPKERAHMIEKIWPSVEEANRECPAHARIDRSHVLFVDPNKPMARAGKGTVMRFATLTAYREEIDRLYHDAETIVDPGDIPEQAINLGDEDAVKDFVRKSVLSVTKWQTLGGADDLFGHGMDSLQGMMVLRKLRTGLKMPKMALTMIYVNPTIDTLARAIASSTEDQSQSGSSTREALLQAREQLMKRFNTEIDSISIPDSSPAAVPNTHTVLLTGSTGALGSYMLDHLLSLPSTRHVYCLNRSADSARLQSSRNATRGLPTTFSEDRVSFLTADLTQSSFLLDKAKYDELLGSTTMIIHNAWPVNFNHPLPSFATSLATIPTLLKFSATARYRPHVHFVSSISSVMAYQASKTIPAKVVDSADVAAEAGGYGHSKQLGELLLNHASQRLPLSVSFSRVGQIAGAVSKKGLWNPAEWFPSIVLSSRYIGAIPETLGGMDRVDWMPIDSLSRTIVELVQNSAGKQSSADGDANGQGAGESDHADDGANGTHRRGRIDVFHPHNPTTRSWADLRPVVMQALQSQTAGRNFEVVPFKAWLGRVKGAMDTALEQSSSVGANGDANGQADGHLKESSEAASSDGVEKRLRLNPAAKLLDFYQGLLEGGEGALFELDSTVEQSATLQGLEGVGVKDEWVRKWVEEWTEWIDDQE